MGRHSRKHSASRLSTPSSPSAPSPPSSLPPVPPFPAAAAAGPVAGICSDDPLATAPPPSDGPLDDLPAHAVYFDRHSPDPARSGLKVSAIAPLLFPDPVPPLLAGHPHLPPSTRRPRISTSRPSPCPSVPSPPALKRQSSRAICPPPSPPTSTPSPPRPRLSLHGAFLPVRGRSPPVPAARRPPWRRGRPSDRGRRPPVLFAHAWGCTRAAAPSCCAWARAGPLPGACSWAAWAGLCCQPIWFLWAAWAAPLHGERASPWPFHCCSFWAPSPCCYWAPCPSSCCQPISPYGAAHSCRLRAPRPLCPNC